jgi:hypothetical protein
VQLTSTSCHFNTHATASCVLRDTTVIAVVGNRPLTVVCNSAAAQACNYTKDAQNSI